MFLFIYIYFFSLSSSLSLSLYLVWMNERFHAKWLCLKCDIAFWEQMNSSINSYTTISTFIHRKVELLTKSEEASIKLCIHMSRNEHFRYELNEQDIVQFACFCCLLASWYTLSPTNSTKFQMATKKYERSHLIVIENFELTAVNVDEHEDKVKMHRSR